MEFCPFFWVKIIFNWGNWIGMFGSECGKESLAKYVEFKIVEGYELYASNECLEK
jgi:hypothetical protein